MYLNIERLITLRPVMTFIRIALNTYYDKLQVTYFTHLNFCCCYFLTGKTSDHFVVSNVHFINWVNAIVSEQNVLYNLHNVLVLRDRLAFTCYL